MTDATKRPGSATPEPDSPAEKLVYVVPAASAPDDDSIDLSRVWNTLWRGKWTIAAITAVFAVASIAYALTQTHWYRADVLLAPAGEELSGGGLAGQLGNIAGLAGISLNGGGDSVEALAILRSRDFTRAFVEEEKLLPILFADQWDGENGKWIADDPETWPDSADGARFFSGSLRRIAEDRQTGLVTVAVEWTDPELASLWATRLVERLNEYMRSRALEEAQANLEYLQAQMSATSVVALQQAMASLLEREHQKLMLAQGSDEFAFRIIDSAEIPETPSRPNRRLMVIVATLLGGVLAAGFVLARNMGRD